MYWSNEVLLVLFLASPTMILAVFQSRRSKSKARIEWKLICHTFLCVLFLSRACSILCTLIIQNMLWSFQWFSDADDDVDEACRAAVHALEILGVQRVAINIPELELLHVAHFCTIGSEMAESANTAHASKQWRQRMNNDTRASLALAKKFTSRDYIRAQVWTLYWLSTTITPDLYCTLPSMGCDCSSQIPFSYWDYPVEIVFLLCCFYHMLLFTNSALAHKIRICACRSQRHWRWCQCCSLNRFW